MQKIEPNGQNPADLATSVCPEEDPVLPEKVVPVPVLVDPAECCAAEPGATALGNEGVDRSGDENSDRNSCRILPPPDRGGGGRQRSGC
jgi:hypothetical protein